MTRFLLPGLVVLPLLLAAPARAVPCAPGSTGISGRVVVFESNLSPPENRGIGEVFVYAYQRGDTEAGTRFLGVSDDDGFFCVEGAGAGEWVISSFGPAIWRPFVRELSCAESCEVGEIELETHRVSDDFVPYEDDWFGGPLAQSFVAPPGASSVVRVTFRNGADGSVPLDVYRGETVEGEPALRAALRFNGAAARASALFPPGALPAEEGDVFTFLGNAGWAPWRLGGDSYAAGTAFRVEDGTLVPLDGIDLALNVEFDGTDGLVTSLLATNQDGSQQGQTFVQGFVARSSSLTHASVFVGPPDGLRRIRAYVSDAPGGSPIGSTKETQGLQQQGVVFAWFADEAPLEVGRTYYLHLENVDGAFTSYIRRLDDSGVAMQPEGLLQVDGNAVEGILWGRIMGPSAGAEPLVDAGPRMDGGPGGDAGARDAAGLTDVLRDSSVSADAGPGSDDGCSCRAASSRANTRLGLSLFLVVGLLVRRRRND